MGGGGGGGGGGVGDLNKKNFSYLRDLPHRGTNTTMKYREIESPVIVHSEQRRGGMK